jgi:hypothetical protein
MTRRLISPLIKLTKKIARDQPQADSAVTSPTCSCGCAITTVESQRNGTSDIHVASLMGISWRWFRLRQSCTRGDRAMLRQGGIRRCDISCWPRLLWVRGKYIKPQYLANRTQIAGIALASTTPTPDCQSTLLTFLILCSFCNCCPCLL